VPYEALIDALGFDERVTQRIQRDLQREGLVDLTAAPEMAMVGRPVMNHAHRQHHQQTTGMTPQGVQLMENLTRDAAHGPSPTLGIPRPAHHRLTYTPTGKLTVPDGWNDRACSRTACSSCSAVWNIFGSVAHFDFGAKPEN
jgi:hypothetical protein